ncbi:MAG: hypothetical protein BWY21_00351 [Parcubacteria group bacterium ADurb.Bin216]|nr:MAG: hypothetical protein BWY21_00351 [Parcubacteria group bacterium ADurb.Bin216]
MTDGIVTPNFKVDSNWKTTLNATFSALRRIRFLTEPVFAFGDFNPLIDFQGMTATNTNNRRCRFLRIYKFLWISVDCAATLAAPFTSVLYLTLPPGCIVKGDDTPNNTSVSRQGGGLFLQNAGATESGFWLGIPLQNRLVVQRNASGNFTAGTMRFIFNAFVEIV